MATPSLRLIDALRETARRLEDGAPYSWGNHGTCNCGNLAQVLTNQSASDILRVAHTSIGEWSELARDYCPDSGKPIDVLISQLTEAGLTPSDLHYLENLSDPQVLQRLPGGFRWLSRNRKEDVVLYLRCFAGMLEEVWIQCGEVPRILWEAQHSPA